MARKNLLKVPKIPKWAWWGVWFIGILASLFLILYGATQVWLSTWKTYRNDELGFSFRYPANWYITDIGSISTENLGSFAITDQVKKGGNAVDFNNSKVFLRLGIWPKNFDLSQNPEGGFPQNLTFLRIYPSKNKVLRLTKSLDVDLVIYGIDKNFDFDGIKGDKTLSSVDWLEGFLTIISLKI